MGFIAVVLFPVFESRLPRLQGLLVYSPLSGGGIGTLEAAVFWVFTALGLPVLILSRSSRFNLGAGVAVVANHGRELQVVMVWRRKARIIAHEFSQRGWCR